MEVFKLHNKTEFNVTLEMLQNKYKVARENALKGSKNIIIIIIIFLINRAPTSF